MLLEDFKVYNLAMEIGEDVYSVAANLSEGLGRYHYKERKNFSYYSRGSLFETITWITKANKRNLIDDMSYNELKLKLDTISVKLNNYIKTIGPK